MDQRRLRIQTKRLEKYCSKLLSLHSTDRYFVSSSPHQATWEPVGGALFNELWPTGRRTSSSYHSGLYDSVVVLCYFPFSGTPWVIYLVASEMSLPCSILGAFLWDDPDQDQWSKITRIMAHQRNRGIHSGQGFLGSFDAPWSEWSWITDPDLDHPKGRHPLCRTVSAEFPGCAQL